MASQAQQFVTLPCDELHRFMVALLVAAGASEANAEPAAEVHLDADLKGLGVQGLDYLPYTLRSLKRGLIDGRAEPELVQQTAASALIDGNRGLGQRPPSWHPILPPRLQREREARPWRSATPPTST